MESRLRDVVLSDDNALISLLDDWWLQSSDDGLGEYMSTDRLPHDGGTYLIEHVLQSLLRQRRALHVLDRTQLPRKPLALLACDGPLLLSLQLLQHLRVVSKIDLCPDDQARYARAVVVDLWEPLLLDVLERCRGSDTEAYEEDVGLRV